MQYRWRMQSLKTGWGMEADPTPEGKKELEKARRAKKHMFKYCRIYKVMQELPSTIRKLEPFQLTVRKFCSFVTLVGVFFFM